MPAAQSQARADGSRTLATPYARRLARQAGIDLRGLDGSGPRGRIKAADVERAIAAKGSAPRPSVVPAPAEAPRAATFSAGVDIDITALLELTERMATATCPTCAPISRTWSLWPLPKCPVSFLNRWSSASQRAVTAGRGRRAFSPALIAARSAALSREPKTWQRLVEAPRRTERSGSTGHWMASGSFPPIRRPAGRHRSRSVQCARHSAPTRTAAPRARQLVTIVLTARAALLDPQQGQRLLRELRHLLEDAACSSRQLSTESPHGFSSVG